MDDDNILIIDPSRDLDVLKGLASETRVRILKLLEEGGMNVNEITHRIGLPQSTIATNVLQLERAGLVKTKSIKGRKGTQKVCYSTFKEMVIRFGANGAEKDPDDSIAVEMPIGLYTNFHVSAPCGLCSTEGIIGYLDVPGSFLDPGRLKAGLLWFEKGNVEYKFPNNTLYTGNELKAIELTMELSSETPGTNKNWLSDITMWINDVEVGSWTSPGDFGDRRGKLTPIWWKLEGSQYGLLKHWKTSEAGSYVDGVKISEVRLRDLCIPDHHSIKIRIGVKEDSEHPGGINIFGRGFGNYDQDILMRLHF